MFLFLVTAALADEGRLEGVVRLGTAGIGRVAVHLENVGTGATLEVRTGPQGAWVAPMPAGHYVVTVGVGTPQEARSELDLADGGVTSVFTQLDGTATPPNSVTAAGPAEAPVAPVLASGVVRAETGEALVGVRVYARGRAGHVETGADGTFRYPLPPGTWDLVLAAPGYVTLMYRDQALPGADPLEVELFAAEEAATAGGTVEVSDAKIQDGAAPLLEERQEAAGVTDVLSATQMSRAGDSDAAGALRRVTGLSVIGGKYVYVRGLGDRYSATTLDGALLPSPEPEKRVVPLDLFPVAMLDGVVVQKTASPDLPGEFGGGIVQIRTRSIPAAPTFSLAINGTYVGGSTFGTGEIGARGPTDWLGFGNAFRALPQAVVEATRSEPIAPESLFSDGGFSAEELEALGESFPNHWGTSRRTLPPDLSLTTTAGGTWHLGELRLGVLGGLTWSDAWDDDQGYIENFSVTGEGVSLSRHTEIENTTNTVRLGGMGTVGLAWGAEGSLRSVTLLNRNSAASVERLTSGETTGTEGEVTLDSANLRTSWLEQQFLYEQLSARVPLGPVRVDARWAWAWAEHAEPDRRESSYTITEDGTFLALNGLSNGIQYTTLGDTAQGGELALDWRWRLPAGDGRLAAGAGWFGRERASLTQRYAYEFHGSEGIDLSQPADRIFVPENIGAEGEDDPGFVELTELTVNADDYDASQSVAHGFLLLDVPWTPRVRTMAGARLERSDQSVSTYERFAAEGTAPVEASLGRLDPLPAATLTVGVGARETPDRMQVRLGYGRSVSRPELRELTAVPYYDYRTRRLNFGNPELDRAVIDHVDLRWEWYPRAAETLSAGVFYKHFDQPIEAVVAVSSVSGAIGTFDNAPSATNLGAEVELRQGLDVLAPALADFYVTGNVAVIRSRVDLTGVEGQQTSSMRPLQGQSPYLVNLLLGYDHAATRTVVNLVYNVQGPRLTEVGTTGIPDTYELPEHRLDLLYTQGLGPAWKLRFKGSNLLLAPSRERVGDTLSQYLAPDWSLGLGVVWTPLRG